MTTNMPPAWDFRLVKAARHGHALRLDATSALLPADADETTYAMHAEILKCSVAWKHVAWISSISTCECCGRPGRLRIGVQRARVFCTEHAYLVGDLHASGAHFRDPHQLVTGFDQSYGDAEMEKDEIIKMWSEGRAEMRDVCDLLQIGRADVYHEAIERGYGVHLVEGPGDEAAAEGFVKSLDRAPDKTRH